MGLTFWAAETSWKKESVAQYLFATMTLLPETKWVLIIDALRTNPVYGGSEVCRPVYRRVPGSGTLQQANRSLRRFSM